jgi:WD40 repeat protein
LGGLLGNGHSVAYGNSVHTFTGHTTYVVCVDYSPDGQHLASGSRDFSVRIWSLARGACLYNLTGHASHVFSSDQFLASTASDNITKVWSVPHGTCNETNKDIPKWCLHTGSPLCALSPDRIFECKSQRSGLFVRKHQDKSIVWSFGHSLTIQDCEFSYASNLPENHFLFVE